MRLALCIVSLFLLTASLAWCQRGPRTLYYFDRYLHHDDESKGALVISIVLDDELRIETQMHLRLLNHRYREYLVKPNVGPMHILAIPIRVLLPLFAIYPTIWLRGWLKRRREGGRGFPVTAPATPVTKDAAS